MACRSSTGPLSLEPSARTPLASIFAPLSMARAPLPDRVEVLEREARRVDDPMARRTGWILPVQFELIANRLRRRFLPFVAFLQRRHIRRRRRRRRVQKRRQHVHAAEYRRGPRGQSRERQDAAVAQQAEAVRIRQLDLAEALAVDTRNSVVLRQALVEERVVGASAVPSRCGRCAGCSRKAFRFRGGSPCGCCRRSPGTSAGRARPSTRDCAAAATGR